MNNIDELILDNIKQEIKFIKSTGYDLSYLDIDNIYANKKINIQEMIIYKRKLLMYFEALQDSVENVLNYFNDINVKHTMKSWDKVKKCNND